MQIAKSAEETRKKSSKNSDFEFGSVIGGAECHFAEFLFFAVKQATIPDYTYSRQSSQNNKKVKIPQEVEKWEKLSFNSYIK